MTAMTRTRRNQGRRHRGERGVAMFIVMMLIVMVSAAGIFVAKSSSLEIRSSGFVRQAAQTHYITESGASSVLARLRTSCGSYFTQNLRTRALTGAIPAAECPQVMTSRGPVTAPCYTFSNTDASLVGATPVFAAPSGSGTTRVEGSFGGGEISPTFRVQVTELSVDTAPQRGADLGDPGISALPSRLLIESTGLSELTGASFGTYSNNVTRGAESLRAITVIQCN